MQKTNNVHVRSISPIIAPAALREIFPQSEEAAEFICASRMQIRQILHGQDSRLLVVVGPCSIHDTDAALEYASRLAALSSVLSDQFFIIMRAYFEKPRTAIGWKGLVNDPDMDNSHQISKGLGKARQLLRDITDLKLAVATETLDPITSEYLSDYISWGAIGARTSESQVHRELASGLSFPIGFKNGTDGNLQIALDAMKAARHPHSFLGIDLEGRTSVVRTGGNPDVHIVLRGGKKPNYHPEDIGRTTAALAKNGLPSAILVDCSHGNSGKVCDNQPAVLESVVKQVVAGDRSISGVMIESYLESGNQIIPQNRSQLRFGVSVTDECLDWGRTEEILLKAHNVLQSSGGRQIVSSQAIHDHVEYGSATV